MDIKKMYDYLKEDRMTLGTEFLQRVKKADEIIKEKGFVMVHTGKDDNQIFKISKTNETVSLFLNIKNHEMAIHCLERRIDKESEGISLVLIDEFLDLITA